MFVVTDVRYESWGTREWVYTHLFYDLDDALEYVKNCHTHKNPEKYSDHFNNCTYVFPSYEDSYNCPHHVYISETDTPRDSIKQMNFFKEIEEMQA